MATYTLKITDTEDGKLHIDQEFNPALPVDEGALISELPPSHQAGLHVATKLIPELSGDGE